MRKRTVVYGLAAIMILSLLTPSFAQVPVPRHAPVNPAFVQYLTNLKAGMATMQSDFGKRLGYVPSPHGPYKKGTKAAFMTPSYMPAPSRFDLRETGRITPVRDQMDCSSCWAFGTYGSLESYLLNGENWDFSERNLNNTHGFDIPPCEGGQSWMSTAYLSRWSGPIRESDDPYDIPPDNYLDFNSPPGLQPVKHFQEVIWFPERDDWTQIDDLKEEIMANGALYIAFGIYVDYYNFDTAAYYCDDLDPSYANHAVTVAGWDDDYPVGNFNTQPPGPGAFIIKNSWGDFGDNGYIYISYYDTTLTEPVAFHSAESTNNYTHQYSYDPLGWVYDFGYEPAAKGYLNAGVIDTAWFANIFTLESSDPLGAVSFYVPAPYAGHPPYDYEVYIYDDVGAKPTSGNLRLVKTGTFDFSGYYTVRLGAPVRVFGPRFSVVVKLTTPDYGYPVGVEGPCCYWGDYSTTATANSGESFLSPDGSDWEDLTVTCEECNVCLKAFTVKPQENYEKAPSPSIRPLAQTHLNQAKEFAKQAEDLLSQAKAKGLDTSVCEKPLNEANDLIAKAKIMITNPVYANNLALEAMKKLKQAMDCLKALLGQ